MYRQWNLIINEIPKEFYSLHTISKVLTKECTEICLIISRVYEKFMTHLIHEGIVIDPNLDNREDKFYICILQKRIKKNLYLIN
jgi:hypothetical protein